MGLKPKLAGIGALSAVASFCIGYFLNSDSARPFFYDLTSAEIIQHYDSLFVSIYGEEYEVDLPNQGALLCLEGFPQFCSLEANEILLQHRLKNEGARDDSSPVRSRMLALEFYARGCELADLNACLQVIVLGRDSGLTHLGRQALSRVSNWCLDGWPSACLTEIRMNSYQSRNRLATEPSRRNRRPASTY